jgi:ABC-type nitrate/sulfonate/bicarbonate transport system ATPase subunit
MSAVKIRELDFAYRDNSPIFSQFNLEIGSGERWSIIGPSGCGKTTLLYLLAGLRQPRAGHIEQDLHRLDARPARTGLILQDFGLLPWATAAENISLGMRIQKFQKALIARTTARWLQELGLREVSHHYPGELSGGQRQRVAIARTLALEPELLLMDEPFASLDALTREDLLELGLSLWRRLGSTMILVTHNIDEAAFWGSKILVLQTIPNTRANVIPNPHSGAAGYRNSPDFAACCRQLRDLIGPENNSKAAAGP